uniref:Uncharacterized protein LOC104247913 isoform X3 n=1 Tax=Nicotiana sylvestris TaxID=4096 RepID=A0A1U7YUB0_NICSY|nr:PREDICTED: uncharacterized protein LOC104247913 isoform X3 [Nicotiana sylvestris]
MAAASTSFHICRRFHYNSNLLPRRENSFPERVKASPTRSIITASMRARRPQNVPGDFFVDHTCIDCDTCRWMASENFTRVDDMSAVFKQPSCEEERLRALQALISCPTNSIHTEKPAHDILEVQKTFPIPIDEHTMPGVYHCGYHSEKSFGAASYLIVRDEGNILVDRDDVADHERWSNHLGCERILHSLEVDHSTTAIEMKLEGSGPWSLGDDIALVHTPGHTKGSVCLLYKPFKVLFTGDHFAMSEFGWSIFERYNKLSVPKQLNSVKLMLELDFEWILPGHGRRTKFSDAEEKNSSIRAFLETKMQLS